MNGTTLLETTPLDGPAAHRGLGRYVGRLQTAVESLGTTHTFSLAGRSELGQLPQRQSRLSSDDWSLYLSPTPYHVPLWCRRPWVSSILDLIPLEVSSYQRRGLKARFFHLLAARAPVVLTLSEFSAMRITARLGVPRSHVVVAPLPAPSALTSTATVTRFAPGTYATALVDLASPDPRKRAAWVSGVGARLERHRIPLVVVGRGTDGPGRLPGTVGMGWLDDARWHALLAGSGAFVYTSAYEGQGLPPLEAMAAGVPVVAMDNTAVGEVVGDGGVLVAERDPAHLAAVGPHRTDDPPVAALADAVLDIFHDAMYSERLRIAGLRRAAEFSDERFVDAVATALRLAQADPR